MTLAMAAPPLSPLIIEAKQWDFAKEMYEAGLIFALTIMEEKNLRSKAKERERKREGERERERERG